VYVCMMCIMYWCMCANVCCNKWWCARTSVRVRVCVCVCLRMNVYVLCVCVTAQKKQKPSKNAVSNGKPEAEVSDENGTYESSNHRLSSSGRLFLAKYLQVQHRFMRTLIHTHTHTHTCTPMYMSRSSHVFVQLRCVMRVCWFVYVNRLLT